MFGRTLEQLQAVINNPDPTDRLLKEYNEFVSNDAQWVFYVQEAMEFAFDLLKTIEMELALEVIEDLYALNQPYSPPSQHPQH